MSEVQPQQALSHDATDANERNHQIYLIKCSDEGFVSMTAERLEFLCTLMPTLRYLLLGHPMMQATTLVYTNNGTPIVTIPAELGIRKNAFVLLVNVILGAEPLPERRSRAYGSTTDLLGILKDTMATLGGCPNLEQRLSCHNSNPRIPEEDTDDEYVWLVVKDAPSSSDAKDLHNASYSYTGFIEEGLGGRVHVYRRDKTSALKTLY